MTRPRPPSTQAEFRGRVTGAEVKLRELATRIDAFFEALSEPPPTPPWKTRVPTGPSRVQLEETKKLREACVREATRADMAEARQREHYEELETLRADFGRLREQLSSGQPSPGAAAIDPETFQELEQELETTRRELEEVRRAHVLALDQIASGVSNDSVTEDSVVRALRAEESVHSMQRHMQAQLLEQEELRRSRDAMRMANQRLRDELRVAQQKRDMYKSAAEEAAGNDAALDRLQTKIARRDKDIAELQAQLKQVKRDLETQEKREQHLRRHLSGRAGAR